MAASLPPFFAAKSIGDSHTKVKRHLYVVLDNYLDGYGVHKIDLSDDDDDDNYPDGSVRHLPEPPVLHVALATLRGRVQFAAMGSSIVAIGTSFISPLMDDCYVPGLFGAVLIYNTNTAELTVTPHLPDGLMKGGYKAALAIDDTLYMLGSLTPWDDYSNRSGGSLHCLTADLHPDDAEGDDLWGWEPVSGISPWYWSDFSNPPGLPFLADHITAHMAHLSSRRPAVRPKILVSLRPTENTPLGATYSFSMPSSRWRRYGEWYMPVLGRVHYDGKLDAWVGLHAVTGENIHDPLVTDGRLCLANNTFARSKWKVGKEKLFRLDKDSAAGWKHVDAKLVPVASREGYNEFCLMERLRLEREEKVTKSEEKKYWDFHGGKCLLRLTFFRVERGQDGEPMVTACRPTRSYEVPWHNRHFDAQAFWV